LIAMLMKKQKSGLLFRLGLIVFIASSFFGYFAPRTGLAAEGWIDGIHGFLLGAAIALLLLSLIQGRGGRSAA
jgi:hypothetical protein